MFKEISIDEEGLFEKAKNAFYDVLNEMMELDFEEYSSIYGVNKISELKLKLIRISWYRNFEFPELYYFEDVEDFKIGISLAVYVHDENLDIIPLPSYHLILDEYLNIEDGFFK